MPEETKPSWAALFKICILIKTKYRVKLVSKIDSVRLRRT